MSAVYSPSMAQTTGSDSFRELIEDADFELAEVQREAQAWLVANNTSDQKVIFVMGSFLVVGGLVWDAHEASFFGLFLLALLPLRWLAAPHFRAGSVQRGLSITIIGTWGITIPTVIWLPDALPIAMQNVIGALVLAAAYFEQRIVKRMIPVGLVLAALIAVIGYTTDGRGLDTVAPRWVYLSLLTAYLLANLMLVLNDLQESNRVRWRILRRAVEANAELTASDAALRESRRRLLVAADEERVRVERDLHDGAQQRLVSLALQLRLAAELADEGSPPESAALYALHTEATEAVEELRQLAQGVYPARLHDLGLVGALRGVARRSAVHIELIDEVTGDLDETVQVAMYFVCLEAIQNATKHGGDDVEITVHLSDQHGVLTVQITDTGTGFDVDDARQSRGLLNMEDRVGTLGGELELDSIVGAGTAITVRVPSIDQPLIGVGAPDTPFDAPGHLEERS